MSRFSGETTGATPLLMQLGPLASGQTVKILELFAAGESETGAASSPTFHIPSTPGTGTATFVTNGYGETATVPLILAFSVLPSLPVVSSGSFNLPIRKHFLFPKNSEPIVYGPNAGVFYAFAASGHTWSGQIVWEEV